MWQKLPFLRVVVLVGGFSRVQGTKGGTLIRDLGGGYLGAT